MKLTGWKFAGAVAAGGHQAQSFGNAPRRAAVRAAGVAANSARRACSIGRNTLTSPELGLRMRGRARAGGGLRPGREAAVGRHGSVRKPGQQEPAKDVVGLQAQAD